MCDMLTYIALQVMGCLFQVVKSNGRTHHTKCTGCNQNSNNTVNVLWW